MPVISKIKPLGLFGIYLFITLSMCLTPAFAAENCSDLLIQPLSQSKKAQIKRHLRAQGFKPQIAQRIIDYDPQLAQTLENFEFEVVSIYRGMQIELTDWNPLLFPHRIKYLHPASFFTFDDGLAREYAYSAASRRKSIHSMHADLQNAGLKNYFGVIVELQVPEFFFNNNDSYNLLNGAYIKNQAHFLVGFKSFDVGVSVTQFQNRDIPLRSLSFQKLTDELNLDFRLNEAHIGFDENVRDELFKLVLTSTP